MFFGSKCVKVAKMCILHIYTRADGNALTHTITVALYNNSLLFFSLSLVRLPLFPNGYNNPLVEEK